MQQKYKNNAGEKKIKAFFSFRRHIFINRYILFLLQQMLQVIIVYDALQLLLGFAAQAAEVGRVPARGAPTQTAALAQAAAQLTALLLLTACARALQSDNALAPWVQLGHALLFLRALLLALGL